MFGNLLLTKLKHYDIIEITICYTDGWQTWRGTPTEPKRRGEEKVWQDPSGEKMFLLV